MLNTYLGPKGYSVLKKELTPLQEKTLREKLTIKPYVPGSPANNTIVTFPAYRESPKKYYLPRYFGEEMFGQANECKLTPGDDINVAFQGELREEQKEIVKTYVNFVSKDQDFGGGGLLEVFCGGGKCLEKNTPVMMYDGTIKMVQDIKVGEQIMGDDSTPRNVMSLARGREKMYRVCMKKGDGYVVNESHILSLKCAKNYNKDNKIMKKGQVIDISVLDYLSLPKSFHGRGGVLYGYRVPIHFEEKPLPIDPYMIGYWLGDGNSSGVGSSVLQYFADSLKKHKLSLIHKSNDDYDICGNDNVKKNIFYNTLVDLDLILNKHIPLIYKCNSRENRLKLLAGLIDSDGHYTSKGYEFTQKSEKSEKSEKLMDDIVYLARSLGFACYKRAKKTSWTYKNEKNEKKYGTEFRISINGKGIEEIPCLIPKKKADPRRQIKDVLNYRIHLEPLEVDDYYGFELDGNRRFVLGDFSVTHNTVMGINIMSQLQKKTIIIVHKEFLMNQWIERIQQFLPTARIGKIQGQIIDIEGKDVVIGMLQSLSMKEYPSSIFESFGLTIIDEVHHISSEVFSSALFKIVTKYMLGLSATMNRKDGTTHVFKMFLGNVVYKGKREDEHNVLVRAIDYKVNDEEFNEVKYDFRGNPQFSTMISKLCEYNHRSEFILRVLKDMFVENPSQQIMILAHNKCLLKYLFDAVKHRSIADGSVGYYIGGMKEHALKETESKKIVIATYSMAAEALDIKTLTTLIMATPKTDIEQSVGRILREKHSQPIVVDIIDSHELFQKQWIKRKAFYKKQNYKIVHTSNEKYLNFTHVTNIEWDLVYDPTSKKEKSSASGAKCAEKDALPGRCLIKLKK